MTSLSPDGWLVLGMALGVALGLLVGVVVKRL